MQIQRTFSRAKKSWRRFLWLKHITDYRVNSRHRHSATNHTDAVAAHFCFYTQKKEFCRTRTWFSCTFDLCSRHTSEKSHFSFIYLFCVVSVIVLPAPNNIFLHKCYKSFYDNRPRSDWNLLFAGTQDMRFNISQRAACNPRMAGTFTTL